MSRGPWQQRRSKRSRRGSSSLRRRSLTVWLLGSGLLVVTAGLFYFAMGEITPPRMDPSDAAQVEAGRRIYGSACAACHGTSLQGQPDWQTRLPNGRLPAPPLDASGSSWRHSDRMLFAISKKGPAAYPVNYETDMPAFGSQLTDQEIAATLAYVKSTWPLDVQRRQTQRSIKPWARSH
jgi:mono/diheme cytochrome c family protein